MEINAYATGKRFEFKGSVGSLFMLFIGNTLLTMLTLGLYYPWAKAAILRYFYQETELQGSPFQFHGTGKEMFIGFIKTMLGLLLLFAVAGFLSYQIAPWAGAVLFYLVLIPLIPAAIVSSLRYRFSRSSWRGIHFGYRGTVAGMAKAYLGGILLTILTLGLYAPWLYVSLQKEITRNSRFGDVEFDFEGEGSVLFGKFIVGYILTILTLGIYSFWFIADLRNYMYNHTCLIQNGEASRFHSTQKGGELFALSLVNMLAIIFTLGLATPWAIIRTCRYDAQALTIAGPINLEAIRQTESAYTDATGEALMDDLNLNVI